MSYMNAMLLGALLSGAAWLLCMIIGKLMETSIEGRPEMRAAQQAIPARAKMEGRFESRKLELQQEIARMTAEVANLRRLRFTLEKELQDARREADSPIRVIGKEGQAGVRYRAWLINRQVQQALSENKQHPTLDIGWATPQIVEVWADSLSDARKELGRIYPMPLGFTILNIKLELPAEATAGEPETGMADPAGTA